MLIFLCEETKEEQQHKTIGNWRGILSRIGNMLLKLRIMSVEFLHEHSTVVNLSGHEELEN